MVYHTSFSSEVIALHPYPSKKLGKDKSLTVKSFQKLGKKSIKIANYCIHTYLFNSVGSKFHDLDSIKFIGAVASVNNFLTLV